jgi:hypothetical protein
MMKKYCSKVLAVLLPILMLACASGTGSETQPADPEAEKQAIRELLRVQKIAWNDGDIEGFMQGYWNSDSLRFIGKDITTGWKSTLARYQKSYPDRAAMGKLQFTYYRFHFVDARSCLVTGRYRLMREADEPTGMFTLLIQKIDGKWLIVYDHTS